MNARAIRLCDWREAIVRQHVADADRAIADLHPAAAAMVNCWLTEMSAAADAGDAIEVTRLAAMVRDKIAEERAYG